MRRVGLLVTLTVGLLVAPLAADAQTKKVARIGYLGTTPTGQEANLEAFRQGLRDHGWIEGRNIVIEYRWAQAKFERLPELATELVRLKVDLIVAPTSLNVQAVKQATSTIPIVFPVHSDPIGAGHIASLARPGGNITGLTQVQSELDAKGLELLKETVPEVTRVAVLWAPDWPAHGPVLKAVEATARTLGLQLQTLAPRSAAEFESAFSAMVREHAGALRVLSAPLYFAERRQLADLALKHRLPAMFGPREYAEAGGLMSYGANLRDMFRRAAAYVDKILKGAKPADLPVEQPTKFELVINLKTAKALGLTIPQSVLIRADEVIQ